MPDAPPIDGTSWRDSIPEDIRGHDAIKDVGGATANDAIGEMARMTINAQAMVGRDKVVLPGADPSAEDLRTFYTGIGCPTEATGYAVPEQLPEGLTITEEQSGAFFKEAHDMGLTKSQAARLIRYQSGLVAAEMTSQEAARKHSIDTSTAMLKKEWGPAFDQRVEIAQEAVERFGGEELKVMLNASGLGNNHLLVKAFAEVGKMIREDEVLGGGRHARFKHTPEEARAAIDAKNLDTEFMAAYSSEYHPGHSKAVAEMTKLFEIAHPAVDEPFIPLNPPT